MQNSLSKANNKSLNVCFVSDTIHSYFKSGIQTGLGGAERQQFLLATTLSNKRHEISVVTLDIQDKTNTTNGIRLLYEIPDVRGVVYAPFKMLKLADTLNNVDADIYYVRGNDFLCMATAGFASLKNKQFVYAVANDSNVDPTLLKRLGIFRRAYELAMKSADRVIAQTSHQQNILKIEHGIDAVHIPNGYDVPDESELLPHIDREYVLWVGSIDPEQKKPKRYLKLARQLSETDFVMIGPPDNDEPDYYDEIEAEAETIPNVEFVGFVDPDEIHDYYRDAIALVNTSDYEGFPNVFLEAWRYATPVVSLHHSLDGILDSESVGIHAGSMESLVEAVDRLSTDVEFRKELGEGGREYMIEHYSFDQLINKYEAVFQSLARDKSK